MLRDYRLYLEDVLDAAGWIRQLTQGMTFEQFQTDRAIKESIERSLITIGEAVRQLPPELRNQCPEVPWQRIADLRNVIVHQYFAFEDEIIWDVAVSKAELLKAAAKRLLELLNSGV